MLGTHNSYHQAPPAELLAALGGLTAGPLLAWQYSHPPIGEQLDAGVRAFELDAFWDPSGGLFGQVSCLALQQYGGGRARVTHCCRCLRCMLSPRGACLQPHRASVYPIHGPHRLCVCRRRGCASRGRMAGSQTPLSKSLVSRCAGHVMLCFVLLASAAKASVGLDSAQEAHRQLPPVPRTLPCALHAASCQSCSSMLPASRLQAGASRPGLRRRHLVRPPTRLPGRDQALVGWVGGRPLHLV